MTKLSRGVGGIAIDEGPRNRFFDLASLVLECRYLIDQGLECWLGFCTYMGQVMFEQSTLGLESAPDDDSFEESFDASREALYF